MKAQNALKYDLLRICQVGAAWLADWCMRNSGEVPGTDVNSLAMTVAAAVLGGRSGDELAAELFNLLGDAFFESIQVRPAPLIP